MNDVLFKPLVILTGAGISAESGIKTFRDSNGLWENHRIEDVATPEAFARNPKLVHEFYNLRRKQLLDQNLKPNAAHMALAKLEEAWEGDFLLVTQNVDNLHERAGSKKLLHMHGELQKIFCLHCDEKFPWTEDLSLEHTCQKCQIKGGLRPDIVWFGEIPYHMEEISEALSQCALFMAIGTSGKVYPAAGFVRQAWKAHKIEVNLQSSDVSADFDDHRVGAASTEVTMLVDQILSGTLKSV
jgi:NAD-dependent deacetylase